MEQPEAVLTGDDAIVSEVLLRYAPRFTDRGFQFTGVTLEGSDKLLRFPFFHFVNKHTGLRMDISFVAAVRGLNGGFGVLFTNSKNRSMDVEDHFKLQKHEELTTAFRYRDPKTNVRNFADSFFRALLDLFDKELKPVVDRGLFEETPVDWMGYR